MPAAGCRSAELACSSLNKIWKLYAAPTPALTSPVPLPHTTDERLESETKKTILYLAYGSNLSAETFKGNRGIKPLSAVNVHVPSLTLTFDLAGIPYLEPCFANTRYRKSDPPSSDPLEDEYHKDNWKKGLIGVVYEVTPEDYRTIIATEGGGASYQDVTVDCYALADGEKVVHSVPKGIPFKAHTLLSPTDGEGGRVTRPDPSYAQASARYLKLITDGGEEHSLPEEYMAYLYSLEPYTITTYRQRIGSVFFLAIWLPLIMAILKLTKLFADKDGKIPTWMGKLVGFIFTAVWVSYDHGFKNVFGDGERTIEEPDEERLPRTLFEKRSWDWSRDRIKLEG